MKKIFLASTLALAAFAANAEMRVTVTHMPDGSFQDEIKAAASAAFTVPSDITHLKVVCQDGAELKESDLVGIGATQSELYLRNIISKTVLKEVDFSEAVFADNALTGTDVENDEKSSNGSYNKGIFKGCAGIEKIILPDGLEIISSDSFNGCTGLKEVVFPSKLKAIGNYAFHKCTSLVLTSLPDNVEYIGKFAFCSNGDSGGTQGTTLITTIALTELPASIKTIGESAFNHTNVACSVLPEGLEKIGARAFRSSQVSFSKFPESLVTLELGAFVNCYNITNFDITLPAGISAFPDQTFYLGEARNRTFTIRNLTPPSANTTTSLHSFGSWISTSNTTLYVPFGKKSAYESVAPYSSMNIIEMPADVTVLTVTAPTWTAPWVNYNENGGFVDLGGISVNDGKEFADSDLQSKLTFAVSPEFDTEELNGKELSAAAKAELEALKEEGVDGYFTPFGKEDIKEFSPCEDSDGGTLSVKFPCSGLYSISVSSADPDVVKVEGADEDGNLIIGYAKIYPSTKVCYNATATDKDGQEVNYVLTFSINDINAAGDEVNYPKFGDNLYHEESLGNSVLHMPGVYHADLYYKFDPAPEQKPGRRVSSMNAAAKAEQPEEDSAESLKELGYELYSDDNRPDFSSLVSDKPIYLNVVMLKNGVATPLSSEGASEELYTVASSTEIPTGVEMTATDENAPVEYFSLSGIRINPEKADKGIFIVKQGSKTYKIVR